MSNFERITIRVPPSRSMSRMLTRATGRSVIGSPSGVGEDVVELEPEPADRRR